VIAIGSAAKYMNGCRRPHCERQVSLTCPMIGSMNASMISAIISALVTQSAGTPRIWL
jgi:hypothetical protein